MTRWTMSAVACAASMIFAAPLWAQTPSATDHSTSPATTSAAPATPPPTATDAKPSACAGLTGTARDDCLNHENAANALCFGMNERVRADCVKSYYPNDQQAQPAQTMPNRSEAPAGAGMSGNADRGMSGSTTTDGATSGRMTQH